MEMEKISVIGAGHVGLVTAAGFAGLGHQVLSVDHDRRRLESLRAGRLPFHEPGLAELVTRGTAAGRLTFSASIARAVRETRVIFICVGTPTADDGAADLSAVEKVIGQVAAHISRYRLIVEKSTVPVRTGEWVKYTMHALGPRGVPFDVAANPEFLREGTAVHDFFHPDRIVIGTETEKARALMARLYQPLETNLLFTDIRSAELIKHASNSFLALKISYANALARICEKVGADINLVARGMGLDRRIGPAHLAAGIGYGGSCFPKDVAAFLHLADEAGYDFEILRAAARVNRQQRTEAVRKLKKGLWTLKGKTLAVLGLAFKNDTDDIRESPSLELIRLLLEEGCLVRGYDPVAGPNARRAVPALELCADPYEAAAGADALLVLTEWPAFQELDFARLKEKLRLPVIFDGRNFLPREKIIGLGLTYLAPGRPDHLPAPAGTALKERPG